MKKFERGSVTVFLTLILIPTIVITAVFMNVSRIKLYNNQAIMAADNYAEGILTEYDNLLKELYGIFAVSKNEEAKEAVKVLQDYMKTSFDPSMKNINFNHLDGIFDKKVDGFMPYKSAEVELSYEDVEDANLANSKVLGTQIGDFMRYRIVKELIGDGDERGILGLADESDKIKADTTVMEEKKSFDSSVVKLYEDIYKYYEQVKKLDTYLERYLKGLNKAYQTSREKIKDLIDGEKYKEYIEKVKEEVEKEKKSSEDTEALTPEDMLKQEDEKNKRNAELKKLKDELKAKFDAYEARWKVVYNDGNINLPYYPSTFNTYVGDVNTLNNICKDIEKGFGNLRTSLAKMENDLKDPNVHADIKKGLEEEIKKSKELFKHEDIYRKIAKKFDINIGDNEIFSDNAKIIDEHIRTLKTFYMTEKIFNLGSDDYVTQEQKDSAAEKEKELYKSLTSNDKDLKLEEYIKRDFKQDNKCRELYEYLKKFEKKDDEVKKKEKEAQQKKDEVNKLLKSDEKIEGRDLKDIPPAGQFELNGEGGSFADGIKDLFSSAGSLFEGEISGAANEVIIKAYTVSYDFGMFSDRVDANPDYAKEHYKNASHTKESITGYNMDKLNYLYGAEMEYLFGGNRSSVKNLNSARNKLLLFRSVANLGATYTVKEVNLAINTISAAVTFPPASLLVQIALRAGITALETYADWQELIKGNSIALIKTDLTHLTSYDKIASWVGLKGKSTKNAETVKFNYKQYIGLMLLVFTPTDKLIKRTGDLICINVNNAQNIGGGLTQKFKLKEAATAIKASCSVKLDFILLSDGFGGSGSSGGKKLGENVISKDTWSSMKKVEEGKYNFSVIRGY